MTNKPADDFDAVRLIAEALKAFDPKDQERILRWAREKVGLEADKANPTPPTPPVPPSGAGNTTPFGDSSRAKDIKIFAASKNPQSDNQFAAVVAYYYRFEAPEAERRPAITAEDLQEATRRVGRGRIKKPGQTLINAHGRGYFDKAERGSYQLTTVGENLVAMALPQTGQAGAPSHTSKAKKKKT